MRIKGRYIKFIFKKVVFAQKFSNFLADLIKITMFLLFVLIFSFCVLARQHICVSLLLDRSAQVKEWIERLFAKTLVCTHLYNIRCELRRLPDSQRGQPTVRKYRKTNVSSTGTSVFICFRNVLVLEQRIKRS